MKLRQAHIYGFGKWVDYTIDFSSKQMNCIFGPNESGKSTLQNFILFMLFGLPPRKREFYRPKTSGKMGGQLAIEDSTLGTYTIERFDEIKNGEASCFLNGQEYDEEWLKTQLRGLTKDIYLSIYSFSALDLVNITEMEDEDLGDVLLGIGLTGSRNIYEIEKRLDYNIDKLFRPRGKRPLMNEQLERVNQLHIDLQKYKQAESTYRQKQSSITSLKKELQQLQKSLNKANKDLYILGQQKQALPLIQNYHTLSEQLESFPDKITFPEDGVERLQHVKEQLLPFKSEQAVLKSSVQKAKQTMAHIKKEIVADTLYHHAENIYDQQQRYVENKKQIKQFRQNIDELDLQINTILEELNIGIDQGDIHEIKLPFYIEQNWTDLKNNLGRLKIEKEQLHHEYDALQEQRKILNKEQAEIENKCLSHAHIEELKQKISDYTAQFYLKQTDDQLKNWQHTEEIKQKRMRYIFIGSVSISLVLSGIAYFTQINLLYHIAVILFFFGMGQWFFGRKSLQEMTEIITDEKNNRSAFVFISEEEKAEAEQLLSYQEKLQKKLTSTHEQLKSIDIQLMKWNEKNNFVRQTEQRLHNQISEQIDHYSFLKNIDVQYWPELFHALKNLFRLNEEHQQQVEDYNRLTEDQENIRQSVHTIAKKVHITYEDQKTTEIFEALKDFLQVQNNKKISYEQSERALIEYRNRKLEIAKKMSIYEQEISKLFKVAQVSSEEDYHKKAKQLTEKQAVARELQKVIKQLSATFSHDTWKKYADCNDTQTEIYSQEQQKKSQISDLENQMEQVRQQLADVNADIDQMESSESYSETMHQYYMEKEQLKKLSIDWAIFKTAREMLDQTKKNYRQKYLSRIIDKTSYYFKHITEGAYQKVYAPDENEPFRVETKKRLLYNVNELSRGTIDQLYVSLRIAISDIMNEKHYLPFIVDDAFLNFDSIRLKRMIDILEELSRKQQVILLTCNQTLLDQISIPSNIIFLSNPVQVR